MFPLPVSPWQLGVCSYCSTEHSPMTSLKKQAMRFCLVNDQGAGGPLPAIKVLGVGRAWNERTQFRVAFPHKRFGLRFLLDLGS